MSVTNILFVVAKGRPGPPTSGFSESYEEFMPEEFEYQPSHRKRRSADGSADSVGKRGPTEIGKFPIEKTVKMVSEQILADIDDLRMDVRDLKLPKGTRDNPARTCRDIYLGHPDFKDGTD